MHKDIESILLYENQLEKIVNTIAKQIEKDYNGKEFIMIGLLKGSVAFMADLMKKVEAQCLEMTPVIRPLLRILSIRATRSALFATTLLQREQKAFALLPYAINHPAARFLLHPIMSEPRYPTSSLSATDLTMKINTETCRT